jgi:putative PIN family toxin of toxin-antitoxin system
VTTSETLPLPWRVVLDTNILISAFRFGGKPKAILELTLDKALLALTSEPLKDELVRLLARKFFMKPGLIEEICAPLWEVSEWIEPKIRLNLCPDEPDNRVLECALEGHAAYIVTGDRHLLNLRPMKGLVILTPDAFLAQLRAISGAF